MCIVNLLACKSVHTIHDLSWESEGGRDGTVWERVGGEKQGVGQDQV